MEPKSTEQPEPSLLEGVREFVRLWQQMAILVRENAQLRYFLESLDQCKIGQVDWNRICHEYYPAESRSPEGKPAE